MKMTTLALAATFTALSATAPVALAEGGAPAAGTTSRSPGAADDVVTSTKIRSAMAGDDRFKEADIDVQVTNGTAILTGSANSDEARQAAEDIARRTEGITRVDNRIATPSTENRLRENTRDAMQRSERVASDSWITTKVKSSLLSDRVTKGMNIGVKTMNGTVALMGSVASQAEYDRAIQIARDIEGVTSVDASGLQVTGKE